MARIGDLSVKSIQDILKLRIRGLSHRQIAASCAVGCTTVHDVLRRVRVAGLTPGEALALSHDELLQRLGSRRLAKRRSDEEAFFEHVHRELRRRSMTLALLWEEYREQHPDGYSYSTLCARYAKWRRSKRVWMAQRHVAGDKMFIDFCGDKVPIASPEAATASIFVAVLGASNYAYAEATRDESLESWLTAQEGALRYFGGVPRAIVPDNASSTVSKACRYEPRINRTYAEFAEHYGCAVLPTRVRKPKDKAKVEVGVQLVQRWILASLRNRNFFSIDDLNEAIRPLLERLNDKVMRAFGLSRRALFQQIELSCLQPLPREPYVYADWKTARVGVNYHVEYDRNHYSVPYHLCTQQVEVKASISTIEIFHKGARVATHLRTRQVNRYVTHREHMPPAHERHSRWDPPALLCWAETIGPHTRTQVGRILEQRAHPQQGIRASLGVLSLVKTYGNARLEAACTRANQIGAVSMTVVANILKNGHDSLASHEREANVTFEQHDNVRGEKYYH